MKQQKNNLHIGIDVMGFDHDPLTAIQAVKIFKSKYPEVKISIFGSLLEKDIPKNCNFIKTLEHVSMFDSITSAKASSEKASINVALSYLKQQRIDALASACNTGILINQTKEFLLEDVAKTVLFARIPNLNSHTYALDLGANLNISAEQLSLSAAYANNILQKKLGIDDPVVKILNIGTERHKGNQFAQTLHKIMQASGLNYQGFIEAHNMFTDSANLILCNGIEGNVAIKAAEGTGRLIKQSFKAVYDKNIFGKMLGVLAKPFINKAFSLICPEKYSSALLLGLNKVVVKTHGNSKVLNWVSALETTREYCCA